MSNESKKILNQIIILIVSPPYLFVLFNLIKPFVGPPSFGGYSSGPEFTNDLQVSPLFLFAFPCFFVVFSYFRNNENITWVTKLFVSGSAVTAFFYSVAQVFDPPFFIGCFIFTSVAMLILYYDKFEFKNADLEKYSLGLDKNGRTRIPTKTLHENVQIVGGTGTGKTRYVIKPFIKQTIEQGLGCFILDVKSNMVKDVALFSYIPNRRSFYHFTLADQSLSHSYNPLYGNNPDAIANRVFTALYYNTKNTEPYYVELADAFLHNLVGLLKQEIETLTFQDLLTATQEVDTFKTIAWFCAKYHYTPHAKYFHDQWLGKSPKDRRTELLGLINKLQRFCNSEWSHLLNVRKPDIRMSNVVKAGEIFLFSPDSARYPEDAKPLCILAMMDLAEQLADRYKETPDKPFRVFLDEFYNLAYPKFIDFINKCREAQVNLFMAHQSMGDLRGVSPEFMEQVMNTASNKIILRVNDPDTAEIFARQIGTEPDKDYKVESFSSNGQMSGYSKPQVEKFRVHPNQIKELKVGQAIVRLVGPEGVKVFRINLEPAPSAPVNFEFFKLYHSKEWREPINESSIPEVLKSGGRMVYPLSGGMPKKAKDMIGDDNVA